MPDEETQVGETATAPETFDETANHEYDEPMVYVDRESPYRTDRNNAARALAAYARSQRKSRQCLITCFLLLMCITSAVMFFVWTGAYIEAETKRDDGWTREQCVIENKWIENVSMTNTTTQWCIFFSVRVLYLPHGAVSRVCHDPCRNGTGCRLFCAVPALVLSDATDATAPACHTTASEDVDSHVRYWANRTLTASGEDDTCRETVECLVPASPMSAEKCMTRATATGAVATFRRAFEPALIYLPRTYEAGKRALADATATQRTASLAAMLGSAAVFAVVCLALCTRHARVVIRTASSVADTQRAHRRAAFMQRDKIF